MNENIITLKTAFIIKSRKDDRITQIDKYDRQFGVSIIIDGDIIYSSGPKFDSKKKAEQWGIFVLEEIDNTPITMKRLASNARNSY